MVSDGSVEISGGGVRNKIERELGKFVDCIGFGID